MVYETWSPTSAPAAATRITAGRYGAPEAANTPAVITAVSLGTTGKKPSSTAIAKIARYTQGEDIVSCSRSSRSMILMLVVGGGSRHRPVVRRAPLLRSQPAPTAARGHPSAHPGLAARDDFDPAAEP